MPENNPNTDAEALAALDVNPLPQGDYYLSVGGLYVSPERLPDALVQAVDHNAHVAWVDEDDFHQAMNFITPEGAEAELAAMLGGLSIPQAA